MYNSTVNAKILITFLVIIAVGFGAYFLGKNPINLPQIVQSPDSTADWKTYKNTKYGYEIKYPKGFVTCEIEPASGVVEDTFYLYEGNSQICTAGEIAPFILIRNDLEGTGDVNKSSYEDCYYVQATKLRFSGIDATKYANIVISDTGSCAMVSGIARHTKHIVFDHNNQIYNIVYSDYEQAELKNQILSTFKSP